MRVFSVKIFWAHFLGFVMYFLTRPPLCAAVEFWNIYSKDVYCPVRGFCRGTCGYFCCYFYPNCVVITSSPSSSRLVYGCTRGKYNT